MMPKDNDPIIPVRNLTLIRTSFLWAVTILHTLIHIYGVLYKHRSCQDSHAKYTLTNIETVSVLNEIRVNMRSTALRHFRNRLS
jgi:hypothetical protein